MAFYFCPRLCSSSSGALDYAFFGVRTVILVGGRKLAFSDLSPFTSIILGNLPAFSALKFAHPNSSVLAL